MLTFHRLGQFKSVDKLSHSYHYIEISYVPQTNLSFDDKSYNTFSG